MRNLTWLIIPRDAARVMRRTARSSTRNIAEGFGRHSLKENVHFVRTSRGSLHEVLDDLLTAKLEGYVNVDELNEGKEKIETALKLTNGYIRYRQSQINKR